MPTFLAAPTSADLTHEDARNATEPFSEFGYVSQEIGAILLSQAVVALIAQVKIVPRLVDWAGPLKAFRVVFGVDPAAYLSFDSIDSVFGITIPIIKVSFSLYATAVLSPVGYIYSVILSAVPSCMYDFNVRLHQFNPGSQIQRHHQSSCPDILAFPHQFHASRRPRGPWWSESFLLWALMSDVAVKSCPRR
jgi:hypothetical protein